MGDAYRQMLTLKLGNIGLEIFTLKLLMDNWS